MINKKANDPALKKRAGSFAFFVESDTRQETTVGASSARLGPNTSKCRLSG